MKEWYKDSIGVYENALPKELCKEIIDFSLKMPLETRGKDEGGDLMKKDALQAIELYNSELAQKINTFIRNNIFPLYSSKYSIFNRVGPYMINYFKFQKTLPTEGYHVWHCENDGWDTMHRLAVYTIYLNDVEEGGETEFLYQSLRIKPTRGTITIFPSLYTHTHRGNPPLSGEKYIVTGWIDYINPELLKK